MTDAEYNHAKAAYLCDPDPNRRHKPEHQAFWAEVDRLVEAEMERRYG